MSPLVFLAVIGLSFPVSVLAQQPISRDDPNPPAPVAPATIARDDQGHATIRAIRLTEPLHVDGNLDEAVYETAPPASGFIQTVPNLGQPVSQKTDTWVMYDKENIYVTCRCWDDAPRDQWVVDEMRRDTNQLRNNDTFGVLLDTFHDRRNGYHFYTNPLGARADQIITDEGSGINSDWNPVWFVRAGRFEGGWTVEMAIPFKSLRYLSGTDETWGINMRRGVRRNNEMSHLTLLPASSGGPSLAVLRVSGAADLVGLDLPPAARNIELKPYGITSVTTDNAHALSNSSDWNGGLDFKYGVTASLTADVTVNTDFAQVEVDAQQVNLSRYSLSYPEKRDFFLEGRGLFDFGKVGGAGGGGSATAPTLFYSRRIGLNGSQIVPISVGSRLTGKTGRVSLGLVNIETGADTASNTPSTNFTVARVKRDLLRRSSVGAIFTNRSHSTVSDGSNQSVGVDANFNVFQNVSLGGFYARTQTPTLDGDADSYESKFSYNADRSGAQVDYVVVGDNFNPEVGLVRRNNFKRTFTSLRFSPRPRSVRAVRQFTWQGDFENILNGGGQLETRGLTATFETEFKNSDVLSFVAKRDHELLIDPLRITGATIPAGDYQFGDFQVSYLMGQQRPVSGRVSIRHGSYYGGTISGYGFSGARVAILDRWSAEPSISINDVSLKSGDFTTQLYSVRSDYAFTPLMFASALIQYNASAHNFSSNLRLRWEYLPGSELFLVYSDEYDTAVPHGASSLKNRAVVFKINRLMHF